MPTGTSMVEKGEPNIAPELWSNSFRAAIDIGVDEGRLLVAGRVFSDGGEEGFWVPSYMVRGAAGARHHPGRDPARRTVREP